MRPGTIVRSLVVAILLFGTGGVVAATGGGGTGSAAKAEYKPCPPKSVQLQDASFADSGAGTCPKCDQFVQELHAYAEAVHRRLEAGKIPLEMASELVLAKLEKTKEKIAKCQAKHP